MSLIAKDNASQFTLCPAGTHLAVCVDAIDKGDIKEEYAGKVKVLRKVVLRFQVEDIDPANGKRYQVQKWYTLSLNEKATLRKDVESWRGRPLSKEELAGFDLENLLGTNCQILVAHQPSKKDPAKTYAVIKTFMPLRQGMPSLEPLDYARDANRDPNSPDGAVHPDDPNAEREPENGGDAQWQAVA